MIFKTPILKVQFGLAPKRLQEISYVFERLSKEFNIEPVVTNVFDGVPGDSGVHEAQRAIDFRDQRGAGFLYTPAQAKSIVDYINATYPRKDDKKTIIHHSFRGHPFHFHIQIELNPLPAKPKK